MADAGRWRALLRGSVLPVLLLDGLAKRLFSPLALTVAAGMAASYVVSMTVTPVACQHLLGQ